MSLKKYLSEIKSVASETGLYTPLATYIFGAILGYPPKHRVITKSGAEGTPDIRLYSQEDDSQWVVAEVKLDDAAIRSDEKRRRIWKEQILERGYIEPDTFYVVLCAPRTFYVCDLEGSLLEAIHIEGDQLTDRCHGSKLPLTDQALGERLHIISYAASLERRQFEAFRQGKLKSGHIELSLETLPQLHAVFSDAIDRLKEYCQERFRELRETHDRATQELAAIEKKLHDLGSGAVKTREKLLYSRRMITAKYRVALELFENDYERFRHDQTYAGTQEEKNFEDIFCTNTAYVVLSRLIFVRICEDVGLTTRKISNSGIGVWRGFVQNIKEDYQDLLDVAFKDVSHVYSSLFESSVFDWFGQSNGRVHDVLERILFRLNSFNFKGINRDLLGSIYQYFRPRVERKRLGEYYTPVEAVDYILWRVGITADSELMTKRILDPACGSFTFGVRSMSHLLAAGAHLQNENKIDLVRQCIVGYDINPFSVFLSHLSILFGLLEIYLAAKQVNPDYEIAPMNVSARNSLTSEIAISGEMGGDDGAQRDRLADSDEKADYVIGNPPFVRNERLPSEDREVLNDLFEKLSVRNTDLSVYFLYASTSNFVKENGSIGMVAPIAIANTGMAAYLRGYLKDFEIMEIVSLEWCAKKVFPGADIIPILIFIKKRTPTADHRIRLVRALERPEEITRCITDTDFLSQKSSDFLFKDWLALSPLGDWCLDVSAFDVPIIQKLNAAEKLKQIAHCSFAIKAGNKPQFLRAAESKIKAGEAFFLRGQNIAAFHVSLDVDEYANLSKIDTAEDSSIWGDLDFYKENRGQVDGTGLGRSDYKSGKKLALGLPSDTLCCLVPEISVTLAAAVVDPLSVVANNSVMVAVPTGASAYCLAAIINSRVSRYYAFLTLRSAILLRRRTTWFPRALKALPIPKLTPELAGDLHKLALAATNLSKDVMGSELEVYGSEISKISNFAKAGFLGIKVSGTGTVDREDLSTTAMEGNQLQIEEISLFAENADLLPLLRMGLLSTDRDEFSIQDIENIFLPADPDEQKEIVKAIRNFNEQSKDTQSRVSDILEEIDMRVAEGLGLTQAEQRAIRERCLEFPLSATVGRQRFAWSSDRKRQARRVYRPGQRFKS